MGRMEGTRWRMLEIARRNAYEEAELVAKRADEMRKEEEDGRRCSLRIARYWRQAQPWRSSGPTPARADPTWRIVLCEAS